MLVSGMIDFILISMPCMYLLDFVFSVANGDSLQLVLTLIIREDPHKPVINFVFRLLCLFVSKSVRVSILAFFTFYIC